MLTEIGSPCSDTRQLLIKDDILYAYGTAPSPKTFAIETKDHSFIWNNPSGEFQNAAVGRDHLFLLDHHKGHYYISCLNYSDGSIKHHEELKDTGPVNPEKIFLSGGINSIFYLQMLNSDPFGFIREYSA